MYFPGRFMGGKSGGKEGVLLHFVTRPVLGGVFLGGGWGVGVVCQHIDLRL